MHACSMSQGAVEVPVLIIADVHLCIAMELLKITEWQSAARSILKWVMIHCSMCDSICHSWCEEDSQTSALMFLDIVASWLTS